jgi:hypothetical protein
MIGRNTLNHLFWGKLLKGMQHLGKRVENLITFEVLILHLYIL